MPNIVESRTILIVDDEERLRKALARSLSQENCQVLTAASGDEAVRILRKKKIDLVVTDLVMPGMDGLTLVKNIKSTDPSIKVIIITAYGTTESWQEAEALGVSCCLAKPFDLAHLRSKVNELIFGEEPAQAPAGESNLWIAPRALRSLCSVGGMTLGKLATLSRSGFQRIKSGNVMRTAGGIVGAASRAGARIGGLASVFKRREVDHK